VVDPASDRIIYANPFLKNELGFEVLDRSPSALLADGRDCPFCLDEQTFIQFGDSISRELLFRNGHWHLCRAKVAPWPGMPRAVLVVATDITEIKQAQEIRDDVDRIMRHDLKSPLSGVISIPDLILDSVELPAEETRLLRAVQTAGRKMLSLINASLILYKLETEDYTIQRDNVDVLGLLHQVVDEVRASHVGYQVTVRIRTQGRPVQAGERFEVPGDPTLLSFTFSNLVKNAMEASEPSSAVDVDLEADERELRITIRNPGRVPPEIEDRFFDKYATAGKTGGAGLGTYSAKLFTQAHGGDIAMRTSEAEGTVLTVTLPR
jgi:signal transduction histidine kinase